MDLLEFINTEFYKNISGYDIEIINLNLRGEVNTKRIELIKQSLDFELEEEYIKFLNGNIAVVFNVDNDEEKMINLHYAYEVVNQNLTNNIYEDYDLKVTIIGQVISDDKVKHICISNQNEKYGVYTLDNNGTFQLIGESFESVFTEGNGAYEF